MRAPEPTLCYRSGSMIPFFIGFLTCLSAFFRTRCNLGLEILALRQQLGILKRKIPRPRLRTQDRIFWFCFAVFGLHGATSWLSSNQKPLSPGIELVLVCSGAFGPSQRALPGLRSMPRFDL